MKTVHAPLQIKNRLTAPLIALALLSLLSINARAQSTDQEYPTPIRSNEISGTISPRDIGDPRLTRYFYSFTGTPGDLIVTVESRNLEGDVDVFTASTLRPLAKVSMYAGTSTSGGAKTIYLKTRESLILRIEARTPNDNDGSFRIRFDGTFEPISRDVPDPEPVVPTVSSTGTGRRVTATGARIEEPPAPQPTTTAETKTETKTSTKETPATTAEAANTQPPKPVTTRRRPGTPRTTRTRPTTTASRRRTTPRTTESAPTETSSTSKPAEPVAPAAPTGPRLIIETKDGMRIERYMTTVRRVLVDSGEIVVIMKNGKVERQPMSNVQRMAIEP